MSTGADVDCDEDVEDGLSAVGMAKRIRHDCAVVRGVTIVLPLILSIWNAPSRVNDCKTDALDDMDVVKAEERDEKKKI